MRRLAKAYLVVRIKGQADVPYWAKTTLNLFKLEKKYRATIIPAKENTLGMLNKVMHYVSWQEVDSALAKELLDNYLIKRPEYQATKKLQMRTLKKSALTQLMSLQHLWLMERSQ